MQPLISRRSGPLAGRCQVPGDKSISHRALILGAVSIGETLISGLLEADDVVATAVALRSLGAEIERQEGTGAWLVHGRGVGGLTEAHRVLDLGNSGTGVRLLMGLVASHDFATFFTGDESLCRRPMQRVVTPLLETGAAIWSRSGGRLPLLVRGCGAAVPITYTLPVASAQVKSAVILAGLNVAGETTVIEPTPTRDHSERLLRHFGADIQVVEATGGGRHISIVGQPELRGRPVQVPGDVSSAAFPLVAATIVPGSRLMLPRIGINPLRTGLLQTLTEMGADIGFENITELGGEPVADIVVAFRPLRGITVPAERAPAMIDEYPILAIAAACADGVTRMQGLGELKVKESDRLSSMARGLADAGVEVAVGDDWLEVLGRGSPAGGCRVATAFDHRIAMAFLVLGLVSNQPVVIDDATAIATSFPGFAPLLNSLGADIAAATP